jgi:hypothetical protein
MVNLQNYKRPKSEIRFIYVLIIFFSLIIWYTSHNIINLFVNKNKNIVKIDIDKRDYVFTEYGYIPYEVYKKYKLQEAREEG